MQYSYYIIYRYNTFIISYGLHYIVIRDIQIYKKVVVMRLMLSIIRNYGILYYILTHMYPL